MWKRAAISKQRALTAGSPEAEPKRTKRGGKVHCIGVPTQGFITLRYMSVW